MFFIVHVNAFKGQVYVFAGQVKIVSHSSCRTRAILRIFLSHAVETIPVRRYLQHCDAELKAYVCCKFYCIHTAFMLHSVLHNCSIVDTKSCRSRKVCQRRSNVFFS